jgi:hypothetical protein
MNVKGFNPSPKVLQTLVAVIFVIVATISYSGYKNNNIDKNLPNNINTNLLVSIDGEINNITDTDGDLLQDWEETLWGADPNNADTDGDGTQDGVEVSLNRDPSVAGPNDELSSNTQFDTLEVFDNLTLPDGTFTDSVGKSILEQVLSQQTTPEQALDTQYLLQNLQEEAEKLLTFEEYITENTVFRVENTDENIKDYLNNFFALNILYSAQILQTTPDNTSEINTIMLNMYSEVPKQMSAFKVPSELINFHIQYINNINLAKEYYQIITNESSDPMLAYFAVPKFQTITNNVDRLLTQIITYTENSDIIFEEGEPVYEIFKNEN